MTETDAHQPAVPADLAIRPGTRGTVTFAEVCRFRGASFLRRPAGRRRIAVL